MANFSPHFFCLNLFYFTNLSTLPITAVILIYGYPEQISKSKTISAEN